MRWLPPHSPSRLPLFLIRRSPSLFSPPASLLGAQGPGLLLGAPAAAPAAGGNAHAALGTLSALPLALRLALCALGPSVATSSRPAGRPGCRLGGDGTQKVVSLTQEVAVGAKAKAALAENHAGTAGLGRARAVVILQLGEVSCVAISDELQGTDV